MIPWHYFLVNRGIYPISLDHTSNLGALVYVSLACLDREEQSLAHGEFLGMSLLLEDILQTSDLVILDDARLVGLCGQMHVLVNI